MVTLLDKLKTVILQFARLHDTLGLIDEDDIRTLEKSVIYMSELETDYNTYKSEATKIIQDLLECLKQDTNDPQTNYYVCQYMDKAEKFIKE